MGKVSLASSEHQICHAWVSISNNLLIRLLCFQDRYRDGEEKSKKDEERERRHKSRDRGERDEKRERRDKEDRSRDQEGGKDRKEREDRDHKDRDHKDRDKHRDKDKHRDRDRKVGHRGWDGAMLNSGRMFLGQKRKRSHAINIAWVFMFLLSFTGTA